MRCVMELKSKTLSLRKKQNNTHKMNVGLINVGRNKVCKNITVKNESGIFKELKKHLMSKDIELMESKKKKNRFDVVVGGIRTVGEIFIHD